MHSFPALLEHHNHRLGDEIGSGQFGKVYKGDWTLSKKKVVPVAVKTLKADADRIKFLQEGAIMAQFKHPNVVALCGVTKMNKQVYTKLYPTIDLF